MNPRATQDKARIAEIIAAIRQTMAKPALRELTNNAMKQREDRRHEMAASLRIMGHPVRPEYENGNN